MSIGIWELLLILAIVFVLFGAGKLPQVMSDLGKGVRSLKQGLKDEQNKEKKPSEASSEKSNTNS
ncbi:MAG: Sec-independent protein translocase subunit TatA [Pelagibacterales bacterium]|nr:Sec-independent protein translocase subunit TatA [Pelagibacterales bacterium]